MSEQSTRPRELMPERMGEGMARFFNAQNVDRYRKLAGGPSSSIERQQIMNTLMDEMRSLRSEMKNDGMRSGPRT